ncbi:hypothetical protein [Tardiphaga sp. P9-11]|uniref:hypothetical protein n=1 Tax=Tardiphaga sp. P9-11 TaxID=2024614 RepID=UPI0011F2EBA4|nr:hypothetical protein [Tardiphaga sp. P9-11]KAA0075884.1 hypothetical protein CIW50_06310 [Tardiphaga sp. P9-11]
MRAMVPIFEQNEGRSIGYELPDFLNRFDQILKSHLDEGRARAFAFLFYNFEQKEFKNLVLDPEVMISLDRLTGKELSVFFFDEGKKRSLATFNNKFTKKLGFEGTSKTPCIVFFKFEKGVVTGTSMAVLSSHQHLGFNTIKEAIDAYLGKTPKKTTASWKWLAPTSLSIGVVAIKEAIKWIFS